MVCQKRPKLPPRCGIVWGAVVSYVSVVSCLIYGMRGTGGSKYKLLLCCFTNAGPQPSPVSFYSRQRVWALFLNQGSPRENSRGNFPVLYVGPGTRRNTVIFGQTVYRRRRYRQKSKNRQPFKKYRHFAAPPYKLSLIHI